jgi:nucleotide-binding universal stress UspA family protein
MIIILVATDFSPIADNAVEYAAAIAKQFEAKLILFNAFTLPVHASNTLISASGFQNLLDRNEARLKEKASLIASAYNINVEHESKFSYIGDELKVLLDKYNPNLIVLGMAPRTLEQDLMGNTTTSAIKKLHFPILAVPMGAQFAGMKRVLFACDVLKGLSVNVLSRIKRLALKLKSEIEVFFVDGKNKNLKAEGSGLLATDVINNGLSGITYCYKNVQSDSVIKEIKREIIEFRAELLVMAPEEYGFWTSLVHRSKTRMMAAGLQIPLLSIPL